MVRFPPKPYRRRRYQEGGIIMDRTALSAELRDLYNDNVCGSLDFLGDNVELEADLGLDSIDMVSLIMQVERRFRIHLSHEELNSVVTAGDLLDLIADKVPRRSQLRAA